MADACRIFRHHFGARGEVLQRSTATVEPESNSYGLHQACKERMELHRTLLGTVHTEVVTGPVVVSFSNRTILGLFASRYIRPLQS